jgi:hypothetical protein
LLMGVGPADILGFICGRRVLVFYRLLG